MPDTGTEKAARLVKEVTGSRSGWVRLDCPSCPPSLDGSLARRRVLRRCSEHRLAAEAVTDQGPEALVDDVAQVVSELVANAVRHIEAPVELTVDDHDDVVRVQLAGR